MSISITNKGLPSSKAQNFGSEQVEVHKLDDNDLYTLASYGPRKRITDVSKNIAKTVLVGVPLADAFVTGITHNGQLSSKLAKSASVLGRWGAVFATGLAVFGVKKLVNNNSETLDKLDKKHRILSFGVDIGVLYGALTLLDKGVSKAAKLIKNALPGVSKGFKEDVVVKLKTKLNNSVVNKYGVASYENFVAKYPHYNTAGKTLALLLVPSIVIGACLRYSKEVKSAKAAFENNFVQLKALNEMLPDEKPVQKVDAE